MRTGNEATHVWAKLKIELDKLKWHKQRIEDKRTLGIPDVNIHVPGKGDVWVEMKYVEVSRLQCATRVNLGLRPEQYIWLLQASRAGRDCILLARINDQWWSWTDAGAWAAARRAAPWGYLASEGIQHTGPGEFLSRLRP